MTVDCCGDTLTQSGAEVMDELQSQRRIFRPIVRDSHGERRGLPFQLFNAVMYFIKIPTAKAVRWCSADVEGFN